MIKYKQLQDREWLCSAIAEKPLRQVAKDVGCSYSAIAYAVKVFEIDVSAITGGKRVRRSNTEEAMLPKMDELISAYKNGTALSEIAKEYGVSYFGIRKIFKQWGVDTSLGIKPKDATALYKYKNEITELYNNIGISVRQISIKYSVSYKTVRKTLMQWGIHRAGRVSKNSLLRDKEWLRRKYVDDQLSIKEIATLADASHWATSSALVHSGIRLRTVSEGMEIARTRASGPNARNWKGGTKKTKAGYVYQYCPEHPMATQDGYVFRHRLLMEQHLGRYLTPQEIVHHRDGVKGHDVIENLELSSDRGTHTREHFERSHITEKTEAENKTLTDENTRLKQLLKDNGITS